MDNPGGGPNYGVQAAVYSACPANAGNAIACDTDVAGCVNNGSRVLNLSGMVVGNTYYFLVDGCAGSACHIKIDVIGSCSQNGIGGWVSGIDGPDVICKPDATKVYSVIKIDGGINYFWYIDGVQVANPRLFFETLPKFLGTRLLGHL